MNLESLPYWGQLLVIVALSAAMGWVFYQFVYTGEVEAVNNLQSRLSELDAEIQRYKPFESRKDELQEEIQQIRNDLIQLERVFPSVKDDVRVKRFVESIANEFDISLSSYRSSATNDQENYLERVVDIQSRGRTIDFMRFFEALVRRDLVIHIYRLNMKQTIQRASEGGRYPVTTRFTISSYVYKLLPESQNEAIQ